MAGNNDSFIVDAGGQSFADCAARYANAKERLLKVIEKIKRDAAGIDWTDDQGISLQAVFKKFVQESEKVPDRVNKNSQILDRLSASATELNNNIKSGIDGIYG